MPTDLQSLQIAVGIIIGLLTIIGTVFGWFGKTWRWAASFFRSKPVTGIIDVPAKTIILVPMSRLNACWWHMGSMGDQPGMQIVGDLNVTNISKYGVVLMGAKLRKPKAVGHAIVRAHDSNVYSTKNMIPRGAVSDLRFDFFVRPAICKEGKLFTADVAIIDQFGNEHWLKNIQFPYV
jgi:hypothetical protein